MHLWPSMRLRDSFKNNYLKKLEWNLHLMNNEKQQQRNQPNSNRQKLLETDRNGSEDSGFGKVGKICSEILMVLSCCYCCFCCGGNPLYCHSLSHVCTFLQLVWSMKKAVETRVDGNQVLELNLV